MNNQQQSHTALPTQALAVGEGLTAGVWSCVVPGTRRATGWGSQLNYRRVQDFPPSWNERLWNENL